MAQNDMSDEETVPQTPQVFLSTTSHDGRNNPGIRNGICLYQSQDYIFTRTRSNSQRDTFIHSSREDTFPNFFSDEYQGL